MLYASDSESRNSKGYGYHPGWNRGVRIGSALDGVLAAFIPDLQPDQESKDTTGGEGVAADGRGNVFTQVLCAIARPQKMTNWSINQ